MNEELQSTNEELQVINHQVRERGGELEEVSLFLDSVLGSLPGGVVVLDEEFRVMAWNPRSVELWGIRTEEALHRNFFSLDIGLPVDTLWQPVRRCLSGESSGEEIEVDATNRRGKPIRCKVTCLPLMRDGKSHGGIVIVDTLTGSPA
jgi:two-component system CheB/CheR fusion protein